MQKPFICNQKTALKQNFKIFFEFFHHENNNHQQLVDIDEWWCVLFLQGKQVFKTQSDPKITKTNKQIIDIYKK